LKDSIPANGVNNTAFSYSSDGDVKAEPSDNAFEEGREKTSLELTPAEADRPKMQLSSMDATNASTSDADGNVTSGWYAMYPKPDYESDKL
jgi:hypothetical protein